MGKAPRTMSVDDNSNTAPAAPSAKKKYVRAVGPKLRILLIAVFILTAVLVANSGFLASITFAEWWTSQTYQDQFYLWMQLVHVGLGLLLVVPFIVFGVIHMLNTRGRKNRRAVRV